MSLFKEKPKTERERVEQRREEVLAQGRKFKYPMQYAKHKLIINTVAVAVVALVLMVVAGWAMLYKFQDAGDMIYRVTQVLPVPVAEVAGERVRYSDYLMLYRSNLVTSEQQGGQLGTSADADMVREGYKEAAMRSAVAYTYAVKLAKEKGITVTEAEIDQAFDDHRKVGGVERSEESFLKIVNDNFGMNRMEYRRMLYLSLTKAKVSQAIDERAQELARRVEQLLQGNGGDLLAVANELGEDVQYEETGSLVDNMNVDGGRSNKAMTMEVGQVSEKFLSNNGDGYYFVKLIENRPEYSQKEIKKMQYDKEIEELREEEKMKKEEKENKKKAD